MASGSPRLPSTLLADSLGLLDPVSSREHPAVETHHPPTRPTLGNFAAFFPTASSAVRTSDSEDGSWRTGGIQPALSTASYRPSEMEARRPNSPSARTRVGRPSQAESRKSKRSLVADSEECARDVKVKRAKGNGWGHVSRQSLGLFDNESQAHEVMDPGHQDTDQDAQNRLKREPSEEGEIFSKDDVDMLEQYLVNDDELEEGETRGSLSEDELAMLRHCIINNEDDETSSPPDDGLEEEEISQSGLPPFVPADNSQSYHGHEDSGSEIQDAEDGSSTIHGEDDKSSTIHGEDGSSTIHGEDESSAEHGGEDSSTDSSTVSSTTQPTSNGDNSSSYEDDSDDSDIVIWTGSTQIALSHFQHNFSIRDGPFAEDDSNLEQSHFQHNFSIRDAPFAEDDSNLENDSSPDDIDSDDIDSDDIDSDDIDSDDIDLDDVDLRYADDIGELEDNFDDEDDESAHESGAIGERLLWRPDGIFYHLVPQHGIRPGDDEGAEEGEDEGVEEGGNEGPEEGGNEGPEVENEESGEGENEGAEGKIGGSQEGEDEEPEGVEFLEPLEPLEDAAD